MATRSTQIEDPLLAWLRARSAEAGMTPEEVAADTLRRQELAARFRALSAEVSKKAAERGLTEEKLDALLNEDDE